MHTRRFRRLAALAAAALAPATARAMVFVDTGSTTFNISAPTDPSLLNSGWQYQGQFGGAFLGTPIGPHNFISAKHLNGPAGSALTFDGTTYISDSVTYFGDLAVYHTNDTFPSYAPLYSTGDEVGKTIVDIGRGAPRGTDVTVSGVQKGWNWAAADNVQRWGQNIINNTAHDPNSGLIGNELLLFNFDRSGGGTGMSGDYLGPNEAGLSDGDSGGGAFIKVGGEWRLAGINAGVSGYYVQPPGGGTGFLASLYDTGGLYLRTDSNDTMHDQLIADTDADKPYQSYLSRISLSYGNSLTGIYSMLNLPPTWNTNAGGTWTTSSNWANGGVPNAVGATADFRSIVDHNVTVTLNAAATVGRIDFDNTNRYTIAGTGSIAMDVATAGDFATISVASGSHTIDVPVTLNDPTIVDVIHAGSTLTFSKTFTNSQPNFVWKRGAGTLALNTVRNGRIDLEKGTVRLAQNGTDTGTSVFTNVNFSGSANAWQGQLDITDNDVVIRSNSALRIQELADATNQIKQGFNLAGVKWTGNGITSSLAGNGTSNHTAVGIALNDLLLAGGGSPGPIYTSFGGQSVGTNDILIKYTYFGDADLSGDITSNDYFQIDHGFLAHSSGWINGDFDYDGAVTSNDYFLIDNAFLGQTGKLVPSALTASAAPLSGVTAVPEPASLGFLVAAGAATLLSRRRRFR